MCIKLENPDSSCVGVCMRPAGSKRGVENLLLQFPTDIQKEDLDICLKIASDGVNAG